MITHTIRPIGTWTDPATHHVNRKPSYTFRASESDTWKLLRDEISLLGGKTFILQVDLTEGDIRQDGLPRRNARWGSNPGVIVSFESRYGPLRYATDVFDSWLANLRAVALALEALRKVDRYGVSRRGEQYAGWQAIEAPREMFADVWAAADWMRKYATTTLHLGPGAAEPGNRSGWGRLYRMMARDMHPDTGGSREEWDRLAEAKRLLEKEDWM